jgi:hypothetical protein
MRAAEPERYSFLGACAIQGSEHPVSNGKFRTEIAIEVLGIRTVMNSVLCRADDKVFDR